MNLLGGAIFIIAFVSPLRLEYLTPLMALTLFVVLGSIVVLLGMRSLAGLGPVRKWVAIVLRLMVLLLFILIIGGLRFQRTHKDLEVMVLRDVSRSTANVRDFPGKTLQSSVDDFMKQVAEKNKPASDRIGVIGFANTAQIDAMPNTTLALDAKAIRERGDGTDISAAIQLSLATMSQDAMHRMVIFTDGNATDGNLDSALSLAAAQHVPIDVVPFKYDVKDAVLVDRFISPTLKRENEPFTVDIILRSTNPNPVTGKLTVTHQGVPMDLDPATPGVQPVRRVTLQPGVNRESVRVPALQAAGTHLFHATFEPDNAPTNSVDASVAGNKATAAVDPMLENKSADAFTFVRGKGQILYVDNAHDQGGMFLMNALAKEGIEIKAENHIAPEQFPNSLIALQNYDAVILNNVPHGVGGLSDEQQLVLTNYVHELGGGLVMIGGEDTFGAGGWQGSKLEGILPVNMDIPAQRQLPKGALVMLMHSCEFQDGNYWGEQCAIKAVETLSDRDEVGVISYDWGGGGSQWDFPLQEKGDGSRVMSAIKSMKLGDMPSFDDAMNTALNGKGGHPGLAQSNAKQKHVIIISDGDPAAPNPALIAQFQAAKVSVSTVCVYPHMGDPDGLPPTMKRIAMDLKGRAYGPINNNPNQLPQIFIKEATVVRRNLIYEEPKGISLKTPPSSSEMLKGIDTIPNIYGLVLTSRKQSPLVEVPIVGGKNADPVLAHWQTGLGKAAVFTSDAHNKWAADWVGSPMFSKFWAQVVRGVARPPMSADFDVQTTQVGEKGHINVEAMGKDAQFQSFLNIRGTVTGPDGKAHDVRLSQTGPGMYGADFDTPMEGAYVVSLHYQGGEKGQSGFILSGVAANGSAEMRDLKSNDAVLKQIADRTGGRVLTPWDLPNADWFTREGVEVTASPMPIWDRLIPILLGLILLDVATRRIAWDWLSIKKYAGAAAGRVRGFTVIQKVETRQSIDALRGVRERVAEEKFKPAADAVSRPAVAKPDASAKFEAKTGVEGDISQIVGGATDKPIPSAPKPKQGGPAGGTEGHTGSLLEAKRRAQQQIKNKEKEQE
jgi:uncharacterized membrane protein